MDTQLTLRIKNMVCNRCILAVRGLLEGSGFRPRSVALGVAELDRAPSADEREALRKQLAVLGFELLDDPRMQLVERIRTAVIERVHYSGEGPEPKLSDYLRERCGHDYSALSKLFSEVCGMTVERYLIAQRIERAKELLVYGELTVAEIADRLRFSSAAHLSAQFRSVTGMSPSAFRRIGAGRLTPLDEV